jgi:heterodisulfide reductase subunit C
MDVNIYTPLCLNHIDDSLRNEIKRNCGVDVELCLECGKCSGGCPNGHVFDYTPRKIIRLVKLGDERTLMTMDALWVCLSCQACWTAVLRESIFQPSLIIYAKKRAAPVQKLLAPWSDSFMNWCFRLSGSADAYRN